MDDQHRISLASFLRDALNVGSAHESGQHEAQAAQQATLPPHFFRPQQATPDTPHRHSLPDGSAAAAAPRVHDRHDYGLHPPQYRQSSWQRHYTQQLHQQQLQQHATAIAAGQPSRVAACLAGSRRDSSASVRPSDDGAENTELKV